MWREQCGRAGLELHRWWRPAIQKPGPCRSSRHGCVRAFVELGDATHGHGTVSVRESVFLGNVISSSSCTVVFAKRLTVYY
jgi:hypothetical protein